MFVYDKSVRNRLIKAVGSASEDGESLSGWSIRISSLYRDPGTHWRDQDSNSLQIRVNGTAVSGTPPLSTDATLSGLTVAGGGSNLTLSPTFASGTEDYTAAAASDIAAVTVTPTTTDADATFEYLDSSDAALADADTAAGHQVALAAGANVIKVKVTAEDTTTTKTYTVTVTRATPTCSLNTGDLWCGVVTVGSGTNFDGYITSVGALSDTTFSVGSNDYTIDAIVAEVGGLTDGRLTVSLLSGLTSADKAKLVLHLGSTEYEFSDATEAGGRVYGWIDAGLNWSSETFVTLRLRDTPVPSSDATLSALSVTGGGSELITGFASDTYAYTASVASGVGEATVAATATDSNATVQYRTVLNVALDDANGTEDGHQVTLVPGATQFRVLVTAEDGTTTQTYTVHVTRAAAALPTLSIGNASATEGAVISFPLTLSAAASAAVTVTCTASFGTGDTAAAADLSALVWPTTIQAGSTTGQCGTLFVQDTTEEEDETFTVTLSNVSSNAQLATDPTAKGTIVDDDTAPTITDVSVTSTPVLATGTYGAGETIEVSVTFDEAVNATSATDFELNVSDDKSAPLLRGSGTQTLVFGYTVAPDDADDNGIWIGDQDRTLVGDRRLTTQAGAITSTATGTAADLTHTELGRQDNHKVDGTRSIVSVAVTSTPQLETDTYGAGETIEFTVTFNVAVDVTGDPVLEFLLDGSEVRQASDVSGSGTTTLVFSYTVVSGDDDDNGLFIRDESDYNNPDGPVRLDSNDEIEFKDTSTDVPLYWAGRGTQSGHKVDGSQTTDNVAPSFTSSATFDAAENQTDVGTVLAADSDADDSVTGYAIAGGADMALFEIGATSGELAFKTAPDFEDPDTDNVHEVTVRATSGTGTRVMTADQTITVTVTDVNEQSDTPAKPTLAAVSGSSTSLTATWTKPGLNGGPDITGYDVQYRAGATGTWSSSTSYGATVTTATITGLTADTSYQVQVLAKNGETDSDWSDPSDAVKTNAETATPSCTLNTGDLWCGVVTVALYSADGFDLAYGFVDASESVNPSDTGALSDETFSVGTNNYTIDQASVARAESSTPFNLVFSLTSALDAADQAKLVLHVGSSTFAFSDSGNPGIGHDYFWSMSGVDWSSETTVTLRLRANTAPVFADASATREVEENSAVDTNVGAVVTATDADNDTLTYSLDGTDAASFAIDSGTGQIKTVTGVTYNFEATQNTYAVTVKADDDNGGTATIAVTIDVTDADEKSAKPDKPTLAAVSGSSTSLTATWTKPGLNGGPDITGYDVQYREGSGTWMDFAHTGTAVTTTVTGLTADTSYQVQVRAKNGETDSDWSDPSDAVKTNAAGATCTDNDIELVRGDNNSEGEVQICHNNEWRDVCDDSWNDNSAGVVCRQLGHATGTPTDESHFGQLIGIGGTGGNFWLDEVMCTGTEANLGACTHAGWGTEDCSYTERAGVQCTVAASGLTATGGDEEVALAWNAPGDDAGITRHEYRHRTTGGAYPAEWTAVPDSAADEANEASHTVTGLAAGTAYDFELRIVGGMNASGADEATARTTGVAAPENFTAMAGDAQVMLSWDAPATGSGVTKHQYRQKTTGSYGSWTDIPNSAEDGANEASHTVTGLTNGTAYTFELRAVKDTTNSEAAEAGPVTPSAVTPGTCTPNPGDIWCGVLTVAALSNNVDGFFGPTGGLSDTTFSVGGQQLQDRPVSVEASTATNPGEPSLQPGHGVLDAADRARLVLHIDGISDTFAFSAATQIAFASTMERHEPGLVLGDVRDAAAAPRAGGAGRADEPDGRGRRGHADRSLVGCAGGRRRVCDHGLPDRGLGRRQLGVERSRRRHRQRRHQLHPYRAFGGRHAALPGFGDQRGGHVRGLRCRRRDDRGGRDLRAEPRRPLVRGGDGWGVHNFAAPAIWIRCGQGW